MALPETRPAHRDDVRATENISPETHCMIAMMKGLSIFFAAAGWLLMLAALMVLQRPAQTAFVAAGSVLLVVGIGGLGWRHAHNL